MNRCEDSFLAGLDVLLTDTEMASVLAAARESAWLSQQEPAFRERVLLNCRIIRFSRNEHIIRSDEKGSNLYFLFEGAVQVLVPRANLEVIPSHVLSPFEWFGAYGALTGRDNIAEYRARISSSALVVLRSRLLALQEDPEYRRAATDLLADSVKHCLELSAGCVGLNGEERVRSKLYALSAAPWPVRSKERKIVISQDELATMSCVSRSVVSKVLSQLSSEGIITTGYRGMVVLHRENLLKE